MAVRVLGHVVALDPIPPVHVVDVAVVVVVHARRAAQLGGVARDLVGEIDVGGQDAGVDDGDGHAGALGLVPGGRGVDVVARGAELAGIVRLAGVLEPPQHPERGVVHRAREADAAVGLGVDDVVVGLQGGERLGGIGGADELGALERERLDELDAGVGAQRLALGAVQARCALDDDVAFRGLRRSGDGEEQGRGHDQ